MICGATFIDPHTWTPFAMLSHGLPLTRAHGPDTQPLMTAFPFSLSDPLTTRHFYGILSN